MLKLGVEDYQRIRSWVYRNARPLDFTRWQFYFENGSKEAFLSVLAEYQNEDGGFAHALEPDCWNPNSSPYMTNWWSASELKELDVDKNHPIIQGILKYLDSGVHFNNGWTWSIPSNNDYPHAPWLSYNESGNIEWDTSVTTRLVGFILVYADKESQLYNKAVHLANTLIERFNTFQDDAFFAMIGYRELLTCIELANLEQQFNCDSLRKRLVKEEDKDEIEKELDQLVEKLKKKDVFNTGSLYFVDGDKYIKECAITQIWWKADGLISDLKRLKDNDRMEATH